MSTTGTPWPTERTLATVLTWTRHEDPSVRRLASEGTRPKLPWARQVAAITRFPSATVPVLDRLYQDESDFVRRSVANHLNDTSRLDPALAQLHHQGTRHTHAAAASG